MVVDSDASTLLFLFKKRCILSIQSNLPIDLTDVQMSKRTPKER